MTHQNEHFGLIGLRIGDIITFQPTGAEYTVGSGNGTPENGGTLVVDPEPIRNTPEPYHREPVAPAAKASLRYARSRCDLLAVKGHALIPLKSATRKLLGREHPLPESVDYWSYWSSNGRSLREMLDEADEEGDV